MGTQEESPWSRGTSQANQPGGATALIVCKRFKGTWVRGSRAREQRGGGNACSSRVEVDTVGVGTVEVGDSAGRGKCTRRPAPTAKKSARSRLSQAETARSTAKSVSRSAKAAATANARASAPPEGGSRGLDETAAHNADSRRNGRVEPHGQRPWHRHVLPDGGDILPPPLAAVRPGRLRPKAVAQWQG